MKNILFLKYPNEICPKPAYPCSSRRPKQCRKILQLVAQHLPVVIVGGLGLMTGQGAAHPVGQSGANGAGIEAMAEDARCGLCTGQSSGLEDWK